MSSAIVYQIQSRAEHTKTNKMLNSHTMPIKYQNIAPVPSDGAIPQKFSPRMINAPYGADQTQSVSRRNARERNRVKQVNNSFAKLRQHIPQYVINDLTKGGGRGPHKKVSKVDTLRIAVEYIRRLQSLVEDLNDNNSSNSVSENSSYINNSAETSTSLTNISPVIHNSTKQYFTNDVNNPLPNFEETQLQIQQQQQQTAALISTFSPTPTAEHTGCQSPTSSFNSSMSFDSGHFEASQQLSPTPAANISPLNSAQLQLKFETYNTFNLHEEDCSPDDDEILDYISLWQDQ